MAIEEKPLTSCGRVRIKRSSYQAYGVVMAIARLAAYALAIGALDRWPAVQSGVLLSLGILYFVYLRFAVPYSRRDEMALEYWQAILDIALFVLLLVLSLAIDANNFLQVNNMGIGMLVVQGLGFIAYFINRSLIIVHAFSEVICSHCTSAAQPSRKKSSRRRKAQGGSLSNDGSISISVSEATLPPSQISVDHNSMRYGFNDASVQNHDLKVKPYPMMENPHSIDEVRMGREDKSNYHHSVAEAMMSRPGIFPAIAEESDMLQEVESPSVWLTERHRRSQNRSSPAAMLEHAYESSSRRVVSNDAVFQPKSPVDGANTSKQESQPLDVEQKSERQAIADPSQGGQKDVFDRFWSSF